MQRKRTTNDARNVSPILALGFAISGCGGCGSSSSSAPQEPPRINGGNGGNNPPPLMLPDEVPLAIYENHPTNKAVYDATPQGQSAPQIDLPADTADNNLFRLSSDGRIWFITSPDDEAKTDKDGDGVYIIRLNHRHNKEGFTEIVVTVGDVVLEQTPEQWWQNIHENDFFRYTYEQVKDILPDNDFVKYLLGAFAYALPAEGPVIITWSLVLPTSDLRVSQHANFRENPINHTQASIDRFRTNIETALSEFENAANLKFIEVADTSEQVGNIRISIYPGTGGGLASPLLRGGARIELSADAAYRIYVHEIGHVLGLKHPFEDARTEGFPFNADFERNAGSERSIMSYNRSPDGLQPSDIAALQFLYGAPGSDFDGLQARLMEDGITPENL